VNGGHADAAYGPAAPGPAGVGEHGVGTKGFSRNLGDPVVSCREVALWSCQCKTPGPQIGAGPDGRDEDRRIGWYRQAVNEARRDGRQGVGAPHSTVEAGEQVPPGPWGGKGVPVTDLLGGNMASAQELSPVSTKQQQIAELAKRNPKLGFTSLAHHIDLSWLHEAYQRVSPNAAAGVDGQTQRDYAVNLQDNLQSLLERAKSGTYRAPPVRRVHIPKGTGPETRPIGIPTFEDKILQRAVVMVLEAVYEQDFLDCSYGFRPRRSAHQALDSLWRQTMGAHGGWIVEVDAKGRRKAE